MTNKALDILNYLNEEFPNAHCELNYSKDYELAIAVLLSAQTTDAKVNSVTPILFSKYNTLEKLANADIEDIENILKPLGLYKAKSKNVKELAGILVNKYNSILPSDKDLLVELPGIGNKSAGVIRAEVFKIADLPVDTHILRISKRLKIANEKDEPIDVEKKLKKLFPEESWIKLHHQLIFFGRYKCKARNPNCENCKICGYCNAFDKN